MLIVEDEIISRTMLQMAFTEEGFSCDTARDGREALQFLEKSPVYDVIVLDLQMPEMSGHELIQELKSLGYSGMVVVHTSVVDPSVTRELIQLGVSDIVFKPIDYRAFASKVRAVANRNLHLCNTHPPLLTLVKNCSAGSPPSRAEGNPSGPGKQFGQYRLKQRLGAGRMGEVYEAEQLPLNRPCAIKFIHPTVDMDPVTRARFQREARAVASLSHPNTVRVFDFGQSMEGRFYYAMELIKGKNLEEIVHEHGPMLPRRVMQILVQVCGSLTEAHRMGLIHRDIKPSNIMLTTLSGQKDIVKVVDFGLVRLNSLNQVESTALTVPGTLCGSPATISPEQLQDASTLDHRADIYSLGCTAYYMLTGHYPFQETSQVDLFFAHLYSKVPRLSIGNPHIPLDLERVILKCLEKKTCHRFPSVTDLQEALSEILESSS